MFHKREINTSLLVLLFFVIVFSVTSLRIGINSADKKIEDAYLNWQVRISMLTDIRADAVNKWIESKKDSIKYIANNMSVKMYLTQYGEKNEDREYSDDRIAQEQFINSFLLESAKKSSFYKQLDQNIKANISPMSESSVLILDSSLNTLVSIGYSNNLSNIFKEVIKNLKNEKTSSFKTIISGNDPYIFISEPIKHIQSDSITGYAIGIKKLDEELFSILKFPPEQTKTSFTSILFKDTSNIKYLSETLDNKEISEIDSKNEVAEIYTVKNPTKISILKDQRSSDVLAVAKKLSADNWYLFFKISKNEALSSAESEKNKIIVINILFTAALVLAFLYIWRNSTSNKYKNLFLDYQKQTEILRLVTENQIQKMFIIDNSGKILFANPSFLNSLNYSSEAVINKPLENVLGPKKAESYKQRITGEPSIFLETVEKKFIQTKIIPVNSASHPDSSLIIENDITEIMSERLKNEDNLASIIETLIKVIEERSIYYLNHTKTLNHLSMRVARDLELDERSLKALDIASKICNLYLALLPKEILNKENSLTVEEKKMIEEFPQRTAELIKDIQFDCPVIETIEHIQERVDGKGTRGLTEDNIIITAKILKAVNDYVAMTSPRAYRKSLSKDEAVKILVNDNDKKYSKRVVYSLANVVEKYK